MGRLIRKKPDDKKKKKKKELQNASSTLNGSVNENASPVKSIKKTDLTSSKKATPGVKVKPRSELNIFEKSIQFLREVKVELKKVTWPSRTQTIGSTTVVLILVMIISLFLGFADMGLSNLFRMILQ